MTNPRETPNQPYLDWPLKPGERGREVWYSLVTTRDNTKSLWHRYTLVSTKSGHQEARLWAGLTDRENKQNQFFQTKRHTLDQAEIQNPFKLSFGDAELTNTSAKAQLETDKGTAKWNLEYPSDTYTFTPLRSKRLTDLAEKTMGSGRHWSANQSVKMTGKLQLDNQTIEFKDAPGHQGHTVGRNAPDTWSWLHCNTFPEQDLAIETLNLEGNISILLRRGDQVHQLNKMKHIMGPTSNKNRVNETGDWSYTGKGDGAHIEVTVEAKDPDLWRHVRYLTPDDTYRYLDHCSLSNVTLTYKIKQENGDWSEPQTHESNAGRAEWAATEPQIAGEDSYKPTSFKD